MKEIIKITKRNQIRCGWKNVKNGIIVYVEIDGEKKPFLCPNYLNTNKESDYFYGCVLNVRKK